MAIASPGVGCLAYGLLASGAIASLPNGMQQQQQKSKHPEFFSSNG